MQSNELHKARVEQTPFEPGELVYVHRLRRPGKGKKPQAHWIGPATVIGREGSNYWLARGGRCLLAAPEHVRAAKHDGTPDPPGSQGGPRPDGPR